MRPVCEGMSIETVFTGHGDIMYEPRSYRSTMGNGRFESVEVRFRDTDLWVGIDPESLSRIGCDQLESFIYEHTVRIWDILEKYGNRNHEFISSLKPVHLDPEAPLLVQQMTAAAAAAGTGPMACVAGAVAREIGVSLLNTFSMREAAVENGGDIFLKVEKDAVLSIYAGDSPLSGKILLHIPPRFTPLGICTSSGTVGHSLSFGKADAVTAAASNPLLADAMATAFCNMVREASDVEKVAAEMEKVNDLISGVVIMGDRAGLFGDLEISFARQQ